MDEREFELRKMEFENSIQQRNFEIEYFWKRGWFFGVLLTALLTGYFQMMSAKENNLSQYSQYGMCIAFIAFLVSIAQTLMNRGSKFWQERWEYKTKNRESALRIDVTKIRNYDRYEKYFIDACVLAKNENWFVRGRRFSVSKLTILAWDIITIFCGFIWITSLHLDTKGSIIYPVLIFHLFITLYLAITILYKGEVYQKFLSEPKNTEEKEKMDGRYFKDSERYVNNDLGNQIN